MRDLAKQAAVEDGQIRFDPLRFVDLSIKPAAKFADFHSALVQQV
jgi:hypothetical protein